jgi:D-glycero-D-manno-heptose 1,7-bisphosphate phosphatase
VTNQSGVARGLYGVAEVEAFHAHLNRALGEAGAHVDAFYYCPYHPEGIVADYAVEHEDRKPGIGMIRRAMREWNVRTEGSFLIGDRQSDLDAATAAGIAGYLIEPDVGDLAAQVRAILSA